MKPYHSLKKIQGVRRDKVGVIQWLYDSHTACMTYHCDTSYSWQILASYSCMTYDV